MAGDGTETKGKLDSTGTDDDRDLKTNNEEDGLLLTKDAEIRLMTEPTAPRAKWPRKRPSKEVEPSEEICPFCDLATRYPGRLRRHIETRHPGKLRAVGANAIAAMITQLSRSGIRYVPFSKLYASLEEAVDTTGLSIDALFALSKRFLNVAGVKCGADL